MKFGLGFLFLLLPVYSQLVPELEEAGKKNAEVQADYWQKKIVESQNMSNYEKFEFLSLGLRNIGHQMSYEANRFHVEKTYKSIQKEYLEKENFINYFTEKIETERAKVADHNYHSGTRDSFNNLRVRIICDTLCYLPSPATVAALGNYLNDERDTPPPLKPGQDWLDAKSNAYQACSALEKIGLRNAPVPPRSGQNEANLATWRLWWGQVEASTRAFSFEGENVEYRFRKDGTWEQSPIRNTTRQSRDNSTSKNFISVWSSPKARWGYVTMGILLGAFWLQWKKRSNHLA